MEIIGMLFLLLLVVGIAVLAGSSPRVPPAGGLVVLACLLALPAAAQESRCKFSESQGAGTITLQGGDVTPELRIRVEGECATVGGVFAAVRLDGVSRPGADSGTKPLSFSDLTSVPAVEGWFRLRKVVKGPFSAVLLIGVQRSLDGRTLGTGGPSSTFGFGGHVEAAGAWLDVYVVDKYTPAGPGAKLAVALSIPVVAGGRLTSTAGFGPNGKFVETAVMVGTK